MSILFIDLELVSCEVFEGVVTVFSQVCGSCENLQIDLKILKLPQGIIKVETKSKYRNTN